MQKRIIIPGSATMELSMNMYKVPEPGETITDDGGIAYLPRSLGASVATAVSRLGGDAVLVSRLGRDLHGQRLYNYSRECGINTSNIKVDADEPTALSVVMKTGCDESRTVVYPGAAAKLTADNILEACTAPSDGMLLSFELPEDVVREAARIAARRGLPIFMDPSPEGVRSIEALPQLEIFMPNEAEAKRFTGIMPDGAEASLRAAIALSKRVKAKYIVIKLGARGAFIYDGMKYFLIPAVSAGKTVDTTGAGDTFDAALILEYLRCGDIRMATKFAAAAAAITVSRRGGATAAPTEDEVRRLLLKSEMGY